VVVGDDVYGGTRRLFDQVHSTTKYLNGHSDMVGGVVVVGNNTELRDHLPFLQNAAGAIQEPFVFFYQRRVKALALSI
jgi:cystathionine gamma-lyase